jgi:serine/threonine-protein kinase HipA
MAVSIRKVNVATVLIWGKNVGAAAWDEEYNLGRFEYENTFIRQGLELAPIMMPLRSEIYSFPNLNRQTYHGLPGLLADTLPDRYGNRLIDLWLQKNGRSPWALEVWAP